MSAVAFSGMLSLTMNDRRTSPPSGTLALRAGKATVPSAALRATISCPMGASVAGSISCAVNVNALASSAAPARLLCATSAKVPDDVRYSFTNAMPGADWPSTQYAMDEMDSCPRASCATATVTSKARSS